MLRYERIKHDLLGCDGSNRRKKARLGCRLPQAGCEKAASLRCEVAFRWGSARQVALFGIDLDRPSLKQLCGQALSAEEIAKPLLDQRTFPSKREKLESDWTWICLATLWQRWLMLCAQPGCALRTP
jgi:hypothetical protein